MSEDTQMKIRLPAALKEQIEEAARAGKRSLNGEIVARLEFSFAAGSVVQETGWDVSLGHDTPEFRLTYQRSQSLEKRVADLEDQVASLSNILSKK